MALGRLGIQYTDGRGFTANGDVFVDVPGAGTLAELQTEFAALLALVNAVTAAKITAARYTIDVDISGLTPNTPGAGVSVDDALALKFPNATNPRPWDFIVPALASGNLVGGRPDMTDGNAIDLLADALEVAMGTAGLTAGHYANHQYLHLAPTAAAFLADRKLARKERSRTLTPGT